MSQEARFWFAPGVEVFPGIRVDSPPPFSYRFAIKEPMDVLATFSPDEFVPHQTAAFRLRAWSESGDVAHYDLDSQPRKGWTWLAVNGRIRAERMRHGTGGDR